MPLRRSGKARDVLEQERRSSWSAGKNAHRRLNYTVLQYWVSVSDCCILSCRHVIAKSATPSFVCTCDTRANRRMTVILSRLSLYAVMQPLEVPWRACTAAEAKYTFEMSSASSVSLDGAWNGSAPNTVCTTYGAGSLAAVEFTPPPLPDDAGDPVLIRESIVLNQSNCFCLLSRRIANVNARPCRQSHMDVITAVDKVDCRWT